MTPGIRERIAAGLVITPGRRTPTRDRASSTRTPVSEDAERSWRPEDKAHDEAMNAVLAILLERGVCRQSELAVQVALRLGVKLGTGRAYVSASLLYFREAGWVRRAQPYQPGERSPLWEVI